MPWDDVHEEAERLEHAMSPRFEAYVKAAVGNAATCPHGHPIRPGKRIEGVPLADVEPGAAVTILRFENEAEDLLHYLKDAGLEPGLKGTLAGTDDDHVVVLVHATGDIGDRHLDDNSVQVWHIVDGKATEQWLHPGDLYANDEFWGS